MPQTKKEMWAKILKMKQMMPKSNDKKRDMLKKYRETISHIKAKHDFYRANK